jgi:hypothetical protein
MTDYKYATKELSITTAESFIDSIRADDTSSEKNSTILYAMIGNNKEYVNEPTPDIPVESPKDKYVEVWRRSIGARKITGDDVSHVVRRVDWVTGSVYAMYDDTDTDLYSKDFYVLTEELNVYKCLYNNNGAVSTVRPTGYGLQPFTTSDGYTWKYLYSITLGESEKFLTVSHMPVKKIEVSDGSTESSRQVQVQGAAVNGSIEIIELLNGGLEYATVESAVVENADQTSLKLSAAGANPPSPINNFYNGSTIYITAGQGAGQLRRIVKYSGASKILTVNSAFTTVPDQTSRVDISPSVTIIGDGKNAQAYSKVNSGTSEVTDIVVINGGQGYSQAEVLITANTIHGRGATAEPIISPIGGHGSNPVRELGADQVMLNVKLVGEEGLSSNGNGYIPTDLNYRTISIVKDPILKVDANNNITSTENIANTSNSPQTLRLTHKYKISYNQMDDNDPVNPLQIGDKITNERLRFRAEEGSLEFITDLNESDRIAKSLAQAYKAANANVVTIEDDPTESDTSFYTLYTNDVNSYGDYVPFAVDDVIMANDSETKVATIKGVTGPEANTFSGEILYTSNVQKIVRDTEQTEDIKIILDF